MGIPVPTRIPGNPFSIFSMEEHLSLCKFFVVHPTSAYPLGKKAFHPLDEIRADTKVRPYNNTLTLALSRGERGSGD